MNSIYRLSEKKILLMSMLSYACIFSLKLGGYFVTGFMVLLADALHTLTDIILSGFLLLALVFSERKADETHMFGYGRAQNIAALAAATFFLSSTSLTLYEQALPKFFDPNVVSTYQHAGIGLFVVLLSMFFVSFSLFQMFFRKKSGAATRAQLLELVNDELALVMVLFGIIFTLMGYPLADPLASVIIASIITINAIRLFKENMCFLLGKSPGKEYLEKLVNFIENVDGVMNVSNVKAEYIGPDQVFASLTIFIEHGIPIEKAEKIIDSVEKKIQGEFQHLHCDINLGSQ